jgi:hypothetical protein
MAVLVLPEHLTIVSAFSQGGYFLESDLTKSMRGKGSERIRASFLKDMVFLI